MIFVIDRFKNLHLLRILLSCHFSNALAGVFYLTEAQKLIYLKGYLQGEALNVVEHVSVNDKCCELAFKQLDFYFLDGGNSR